MKVTELRQPLSSPIGAGQGLLLCSGKEGTRTITIVKLFFIFSSSNVSRLFISGSYTGSHIPAAEGYLYCSEQAMEKGRSL
jgi:hypothetical protein